MWLISRFNTGLQKHVQELLLFSECAPEKSLFVNPIFNLQLYETGERFKKYHCGRTISEEVIEPIHRVFAWILYSNDVDSGGKEFHLQKDRESDERRK